MDVPEESTVYEEIVELIPVGEEANFEPNPTDTQGKPRNIYAYYFQ